MTLVTFSSSLFLSVQEKPEEHKEHHGGDRDQVFLTLGKHHEIVQSMHYSSP